MAVEENLNSLGISFEVMDAVDGSRLSPEQRSVYSEHRSLEAIGRALSPGEIGCALSHVAIYEVMIRKKIPMVLVLEDDAILSASAVVAIGSLLGTNHNWDAINLVSDSPERVGVPISSSSEFRFTEFEFGANRTGAYIVSLSGAEKLIGSAYPIRVPADALTGSGFCPTLVLRGLHPGIATLLPVASTFQKGSFRHKHIEWERKVASRTDPSMLILNKRLEPGFAWRLRARGISSLSAFLRTIRF